MTVDISETYPAGANVEDISRFAASTLEREGVGGGAVLSLSFVDVDAIAQLNEEYLGKEGPTDVLSFPIEDATPGSPPQPTAGGPPLHLGDIFISPDVVARHARELDVSYGDELYLMVCHGLLHILGWDHQTEPEAEAMEAREAEHLATIGRTRR